MKTWSEFGTSARHRWSVASRVLAAAVGGYALVSLLTLALSLLLGHWGLKLPQTILALNMASFLFFAAVIMAVFHARSAGRAWMGLLGTSVPLGLVIWLLLPGAAP